MSLLYPNASQSRQGKGWTWMCRQFSHNISLLQNWQIEGQNISFLHAVYIKNRIGFKNIPNEDNHGQTLLTPLEKKWLRNMWTERFVFNNLDNINFWYFHGVWGLIMVRGNRIIIEFSTPYIIKNLLSKNMHNHLCPNHLPTSLRASIMLIK